MISHHPSTTHAHSATSRGLHFLRLLIHACGAVYLLLAVCCRCQPELGHVPWTGSRRQQSPVEPSPRSQAAADVLGLVPDTTPGQNTRGEHSPLLHCAAGVPRSAEHHRRRTAQHDAPALHVTLRHYTRTHHTGGHYTPTLHTQPPPYTNADTTRDITRDSTSLHGQDRRQPSRTSGGCRMPTSKHYDRRLGHWDTLHPPTLHTLLGRETERGPSMTYYCSCTHH